jgi:hypothetical protein
MFAEINPPAAAGLRRRVIGLIDCVAASRALSVAGIAFAVAFVTCWVVYVFYFDRVFPVYNDYSAAVQRAGLALDPAAGLVTSDGVPVAASMSVTGEVTLGELSLWRGRRVYHIAGRAADATDDAAPVTVLVFQGRSLIAVAETSTEPADAAPPGGPTAGHPFVVNVRVPPGIRGPVAVRVFAMDAAGRAAELPIRSDTRFEILRRSRR